MITLTILGCDGSHAGPLGAGSGYLVRDFASGTQIWLDAGPGTFANLQRYCDASTLSAIVLTHEHVDHWHDVFQLLTAARWTMSFERDPIPVVAAPNIRERLSEDIEGVFEWHTVGDGDGMSVGGFRLSFSRTDHGPVTLGVRLEADGTSLGYSADSGPAWSLRELGDELDLALCEATYTRQHEGSEAGHMSGREAGMSAKDARARRLVITHRWAKISASSVYEEAVGAFGGRVDQAAIGRGFSA